jgi:hypothetical protein
MMYCRLRRFSLLPPADFDPKSKIWASISTTLPSAKKLFRPGVLSRVWCLGPCDDLRGCEAVPIWLLRGRYDTQGPRYARKNSTTLGLDSTRTRTTTTTTKTSMWSMSMWSWGTAGQHPERRVDWQHQ